MRRNHKDLRAWQSAMQLVEMVYRLTSTFPREEIYGLSSQMRRAAVSVPSNIAEGAARQSTKDLLRFLVIASGSLAELDTQLELSLNIGYCQDTSTLQLKIDEVSALTHALMKSLKERE